MKTNIEEKIEELKEILIDDITTIFCKHSRKDDLGEVSIQSGEICDESLYIVVDEETSYDDNTDSEVIHVDEIAEFWYDLGEVDVRTFEHGSMSLGNLSIDNLIKCHEYLSLLENETE